MTCDLSAAATGKGVAAGLVAGAGLSVFAAVLQEPEDAEVAGAAEREQRHLDGEEGSRSGSAGEPDRGALPVLDDIVEELAELGQVGGVNAGDGRGEQLPAGVAEQRAARAVGGQDPVAEGSTMNAGSPDSSNSCPNR
jgi:hypothetical protein